MENNLKSLEKKMRSVWIIGGGIFFFIYMIIMIVICVVGYYEGFLIPAVITSAIVCVLLGLICFGYPFLKYHFYKYSYEEKKIFIQFGVIFRHKIVVPTCQIQDLHIYQGPIMTIFKLGGVIISTAGSNYLINGLNLDDAKKMVEELEANLEKRIEELKDE